VQDAVNFLLDRILRQMYKRYGGLPLNRVRLIPAVNPATATANGSAGNHLRRINHHHAKNGDNNQNNGVSSQASYTISNQRIANRFSVSPSSSYPSNNNSGSIDHHVMGHYGVGASGSTSPHNNAMVHHMDRFPESLSDEFFNQLYESYQVLNKNHSPSGISSSSSTSVASNHDAQEDLMASMMQDVYTSQIKEELEHEATDGSDDYDVTPLANFYFEVKSFFDQIIERLKKYELQMKDHPNRKNGMLRLIEPSIQLAKEEQLSTLDKVTLLFNEISKYLSGADFGAANSSVLGVLQLSNKLNVLKRAVIELKREFYTTTTHNWSLLWYSLKTEVMMDVKSDDIENSDPLLIHLTKRREHLESKRLYRTRHSFYSDDVEQRIKRKANVSETQFNFQSIVDPLDLSNSEES